MLLFDCFNGRQSASSVQDVGKSMLCIIIVICASLLPLCIVFTANPLFSAGKTPWCGIYHVQVDLALFSVGKRPVVWNLPCTGVFSTV